MITSLFWVQGTYYFATGLLPLLSVESFQWVTGRKTDHLPTGREGDHWLVMTVGVLVTAVAVAMVYAAWRKSETPEVIVLAMASALGLLGIDVIYVSRGAIAPIYLADAALEAALLAAWCVALFRHKASGSVSAAAAPAELSSQ